MTEQPAVDLLSNIVRTRERIAAAAERAGRRAEEICLVAVSKVVPAERVQQAIEAGLTDLGENYVQEAAEKRAALTRTGELAYDRSPAAEQSRGGGAAL